MDLLGDDGGGDGNGGARNCCCCVSEVREEHLGSKSTAQAGKQMSMLCTVPRQPQRQKPGIGNNEIVVIALVLCVCPCNTIGSCDMPTMKAKAKTKNLGVVVWRASP